MKYLNEKWMYFSSRINTTEANIAFKLPAYANITNPFEIIKLLLFVLFCPNLNCLLLIKSWTWILQWDLYLCIKTKTKTRVQYPLLVRLPSTSRFIALEDVPENVTSAAEDDKIWDNRLNKNIRNQHCDRPHTIFLGQKLANHKLEIHGIVYLGKIEHVQNISPQISPTHSRVFYLQAASCFFWALLKRACRSDSHTLPLC